MASLVDAVVAVQQVGQGQLVYWQLPMKDIASDPRAQIAIRNTLLYLAAENLTIEFGPAAETTYSGDR